MVDICSGTGFISTAGALPYFKTALMVDKDPDVTTEEELFEKYVKVSEAEFARRRPRSGAKSLQGKVLERL